MVTVDRVVVISLERRPDRRAAFFAGLPQPWGLPEVEVSDALDGTTCAPVTSWHGGRGAYGCAVSHVRVLRAGIADQVGALLVMEDDAMFTQDFARQLPRFLAAVPDDWEMLMLGGQHVATPRRVNDLVDRCRDTQRTHAYIVRHRALHALDGVWSKASTHIDHLLPNFQSRHPTYAPRSFLVGQAGGYSDIVNRVVRGFS